MRIGIVTACAASLVTVVPGAASPAAAYCFKGIGRWKGDRYTLHVRRDIPRGWRSSVRNAMRQWSGIKGSKLRYAGPRFASTARSPAFQIFRANFADAGLPDVPGIAFGTDTPRHTSSSVALNTRFHWNTKGRMSQRARRTDVWTIAVHEMGHSSGLAHPYASGGCGRPTAAEKAGVMYVNWTRKRYPNADDRAGIARRY
ncbi:matrixin family metalloprotease [Actinomadura macrotermitis]|nr:matrixin family metalloprotease [Actinomadura macrotermitis]